VHINPSPKLQPADGFGFGGGVFALPMSNIAGLKTQHRGELGGEAEGTITRSGGYSPNSSNSLSC
jgi:hypothetical protein